MPLYIRDLGMLSVDPSLKSVLMLVSYLRNGSSHLGLMAFLFRHRYHLA